MILWLVSAEDDQQKMVIVRLLRLPKEMFATDVKGEIKEGNPSPSPSESPETKAKVTPITSPKSTPKTPSKTSPKSTTEATPVP